MICPRQFFGHCTNARLDRALTGWYLAWIWTQRDFLMKGNNAISLDCQSQVFRPCSWVFLCPKVSVANGSKTKSSHCFSIWQRQRRWKRSEQWVPHKSGKVHADSEFGKEKKKVGQALVRVSACCCSVEELTGPGTVAAETLISEVSMLPQPFCDFYLPFLISRWNRWNQLCDLKMGRK